MLFIGGIGHKFKAELCAELKTCRNKLNTCVKLDSCGNKLKSCAAEPKLDSSAKKVSLCDFRKYRCEAIPRGILQGVQIVREWLRQGGGGKGGT